MRSLPVRLLALILAPLLVLTACGGDDDDSGGSSSSDDIEVTGDFGKAPEVDIPDKYSVDESDTRVISEGDGAEVKAGDDVLVQLAAYNGTTGADIFSMFSGQTAQPQTMKVDDKASLIPGLADRIEGQTVGSRLLVSITPEDGFGEQGNSQAGIGPDDTVVALVDLLPTEEAPKATGTIDDVKVTGSYGSKPTIDFKTPLFVDKTQSKVISKGDGDTVKAGDTVKVDYLGVNGRTGKEFDTSWKKGKSTPVDFPLTEGQLIPGFIQGLVGQKLGSRVAIAIPRDDAYGAGGNAQAGIEGTDTLVFVVDLQKPPEQPKATGTINDVKVTGKAGAKPKVTFKKPFYVAKTESKVLSQGSGTPLKAGDTVKVNYVGINGRSGKEFDGNYGGDPAEFTLTADKLIPGFIKGLIGQKPGSRVLITIPRDDGYGPNGNTQAGIEGTDTLVFVLDIAKK
ncbi:FKBP-type peptidyl-prolyl cis-trans isomerase [Solicola gregarius]|uniref:peptidylprolyl isomerase n=1 Tax=Solicola gregarius TaxID=2908642 RepID=A0AA46YL05_9ACTN|nr:FKBP-type peptidyl-prolyl cis-trans isomerase [Solicola gregarius]UYM05051.1 FKBP-type peptidyl-prolyl cis-trans isomerase [Solicola gregarius]